MTGTGAAMVLAAMLLEISTTVFSILSFRVGVWVVGVGAAVVLAATLFAPLRPWSSERAKPWSEEQRKVLKRRVRFMQALIEDARLKGFAAPLERP